MSLSPPSGLESSPLRADRQARRKSALALLLMLVVTECFYLRPGILRGVNSLFGMDYQELQIHRLRFAREAPGSPFAANLQSFPWIPTRLLLLPFDPSVAYAAGVGMAAPCAAQRTGGVCLSLHLVNLWGFSSLFIRQAPLKNNLSSFFEVLDRETCDGRIAALNNLIVPY